MKISDAAYIAGLFDGEGSVEYKKRKQHKKGSKKAYDFWSIRCEISMTDQGVMEWFHETIGFGSLKKINDAFQKRFKKFWKNVKKCEYKILRS